MNHIGLFEGIGGFSLAARWMGWSTIAWCEINPFGQQVLKHHFPYAKGHSDIKTTDFTIYRGKCGILTAGFPCQPSSTAGKRKGTEDDRWLWPDTRKAYQQARPNVLVLENVTGLTSILEPACESEMERAALQSILQLDMGLYIEPKKRHKVQAIFKAVQKRALATIISEIRSDGYVLPEYSDGTPIIFCIPACAVNAPHRRDRVWIVAKDSNQDGWGSQLRKEESKDRGQWNPGTGDNEWIQANNGEVRLTPNPRHAESPGRIQTPEGQQYDGGRQSWSITSSPGGSWDVANPNPSGLQEWVRPGFGSDGSQAGAFQGGEPSRTYPTGGWSEFPTQSPICSRNDGLSSGLDGVTFSKWRQESIKAYGNAIVPELAYQIFKAIDQFEKQNQ